MRILLVEDDTMIGEATQAGLRRENFTTDWVRDGESATLALKTTAFDGMVLDLGLPRKTGLQVLRDLRSDGDQLPVLILTARDAISDKVTGLDAGADDYLVKPFDLSELGARLRALARRHGGRASTRIEYATLVLDTTSRQLLKDGQDVPLSPREYSVLHALLERPGTLLSRAQLEERLYGWGEEVESNAVEVHIHGLRRKLGADLIRNVRGVGYRVASPPR